MTDEAVNKLKQTYIFRLMNYNKQSFFYYKLEGGGGCRKIGLQHHYFQHLNFYCPILITSTLGFLGFLSRLQSKIFWLIKAPIVGVIP